MDRRQFLAAPLVSMAVTRLAGQVAHPALSTGTPNSLIRTDGSLRDLDGATDWFNTAPLRSRALRRKVVLVNFGTYSCINSLRPLPYLKHWAAQYGNAGLIVLFVHTPEFSFEKQRANVEGAVRELEITYPVAMDSDYRIWRAFGNNYWPAFYVADAKGNIRDSRFGEGQYSHTERAIQALLNKSGAARPMANPAPISAAGVEAAPSADVRTPETDVGNRQAERFSSPERVGRDSRKVYTSPPSLRLNQWCLDGLWEIGAERGHLREPQGTLTILFHSRDLHRVLGPAESGRPVRFRVTLDGAAPGRDAGVDSRGDGTGEVREPRLYQFIRQRGRCGTGRFRSSSSIPASERIHSRLARRITPEQKFCIRDFSGLRD